MELHPLLDSPEAWPHDLDHFSASSVKMLVRCPEQWRQRYVLGKRYPPAINLLTGRADHSAIEASMVDKINTTKDWPVKEVRDRFADVLKEEIEKEGGIVAAMICGSDIRAAIVGAAGRNPGPPEAVDGIAALRLEAPVPPLGWFRTFAETD